MKDHAPLPAAEQQKPSDYTKTDREGPDDGESPLDRVFSDDTLQGTNESGNPASIDENPPPLTPEHQTGPGGTTASGLDTLPATAR